MALLAQGFDPSGYTPSYAVANAANQELFNRQSVAQQEVQGAITDYQKEQKALAQKDKEMAAKIKGTISLLDNAKALYPDFAERIDATKLQLVDPSLSSLDKLGIAGNVEGSLNMMVTKGSDVMKAQLIEAQIYEARAGRRTAPSYEMKKAIIPTSEGNIEYELPWDSKAGRFFDPNTLTPIKDLNKWYQNETGWEAGPRSTSSINSNNIKATAFGQPEYDPTTRQEIASGRMAQVKGDPSIGSGGIRYRGLEDSLPTVATKDYPAGSVLNVKSNLFPEGRQFEVAGTGPKSGVLDFYASNKSDYDKLAGQQISGIDLVGQPQPQSRQGAIESAAAMNRPVTQEEQANAIRVAAESANRATASTGVPAMPATGDAVPVGGAQAPMRPAPRVGGRLVLSDEQKQARSAKAEIQAYRQSLENYGVNVPEAMNKGISDAALSDNSAELVAYANSLKEMADEAGKAKTSLAPIAEKERLDVEKATKAARELKAQGELSKGVAFRHVDEAREIVNRNPSTGLYSSAAKAISGYYPQSDQARLNDVVDGLRAVAKFDSMQKMRMASPTGATGLGQLSNAEGQSLEKKSTLIRSSGKPTDIIKDLDSFKTDMLDTAHGSRTQRLAMLQNGAITKEQFNQAEADYPAPKLLSAADTSLLTPQSRSVIDKVNGR